MRTTRIKIFQQPSYHTIEEMFNAWVTEREREMQRKSKTVKEVRDILQIPPTVFLSFDQSLQKYFLMVTYFEIVDDEVSDN